MKLPEPVAWVDSIGRPQPICVTDLAYCSVAEWDSGKYLKYTPLYTADQMKAVRRQALEDVLEMNHDLSWCSPNEIAVAIRALSRDGSDD
jgi:hypothetical protein